MPAFAHLLVQRGLCYLERNWEGDTMDALRDFLYSLQIDGTHTSKKDAHFFLLKALIKLKQADLAETCYNLYVKRFPDGSALQELKEQLEQLKSLI